MEHHPHPTLRMNPPLLPKDPRHQRFADLILRGMEAREAYGEAFPDSKPSSWSAAACRAKKRADVKAYIDSIRIEARDETLLTVLEKRRFCAHVVRTSLTSIDLDDPENAANAVLKSYSISETETSTSRSLTKLDSLAAIELDNKLSGDDSGTNALRELADALHSLAGGPIPTDKL